MSYTKQLSKLLIAISVVLLIAGSVTTVAGMVQQTSEQQTTQESGPSNTVTIQGTGPLVDYTFQATDIEPAESADVEDNTDQITGDTVRGNAAKGGADKYRFNGPLESFQSENVDVLNVSINGRQIDPTILQDGHHVIITKDEPGVENGEVTYGFSVNGNLVQGTTADSSEPANGSSASGGMGPESGTDDFYFTGEITSFDLSGDARVYIDGERADIGTSPTTTTVTNTETTTDTGTGTNEGNNDWADSCREQSTIRATTGNYTGTIGTPQDSDSFKIQLSKGEHITVAARVAAAHASFQVDIAGEISRHNLESTSDDASFSDTSVYLADSADRATWEIWAEEDTEVCLNVDETNQEDAEFPYEWQLRLSKESSDVNQISTPTTTTTQTTTPIPTTTVPPTTTTTTIESPTATTTTTTTETATATTTITQTPTTTTTPAPTTTPEPSVSVVNLSADDETIEVNESVEFTATIENTGPEQQSGVLELVTFGEIVGSKEITVDSGETQTVSFNHTYEVPGTYIASVGNQELQIQVEATGDGEVVTTGTPDANGTSAVAGLVGAVTGVANGFLIVLVVVAVIGGAIIAVMRL